MNGHIFKRIMDLINPGLTEDIAVVLTGGQRYHGIVSALPTVVPPGSPSTDIGIEEIAVFTTGVAPDEKVVYVETTAIVDVGLYEAAPAVFLTALDITAAGVIKASSGRFDKLLVSEPGTAGQLTLNDCTTVAAATAANRIITIPFSELADGQIVDFDWPFAAGLVVSEVPTGGVFAISYN